MAPTTAGAPGAAISGSTRLYPVLGEPVAQVKAPGLLNPLLAGWGVDAVVVPLRVAPRDLADVLGALRLTANVAGLLVTIPHKAAICALADEVSPTAALSGTANALRRLPDGRWHAENFDGAGFVRGLRSAGHRVRGRQVTVVGAGGAGSAIAVALLTGGAARVTLCEANPQRLAAVAERLAARWPNQVCMAEGPHSSDSDLVVNATPLGLLPGDPLPFDPAALGEHVVVADIIMQPARTALLDRAAATGHRVHPGIHMLEQQVPLYREFFAW
jgi:shikimate dehydrogenase